MSNSVVKCKELLSWNGEEEEFAKLRSTSVCPVIIKNKKLFYEVEVDEKKKQFSPEDILVHIYKKLYGELFDLLGFPNKNPFNFLGFQILQSITQMLWTNR